MRGTSRLCVRTAGAAATAHAGEAERRQGRLERGAVGVLDDERSRAELAPGRVELLFRRLHGDVLVLEAERHEGVVGGVLDDQHRPRAVDAARRPDVGVDRGHLLIERALVLDRLDHQVAHVLESPAGIVVRTRIGRRVVLHREVHVGDRAIRLVAADDVVARLDFHGAGLERRAARCGTRGPAGAAR